MFTDIHSHILCEIDDGPKNFDESVALLNAAVADGVKNLVATPHFFPNIHALHQKLTTAKNIFSQLEDYVKKNNIPVTLLCGFEVRYFRGISRIDGLDQLCINNSNVLLLELSREPITEEIIDEILRLCYMGYIVVLAHIERYVKMPGFEDLKQSIIDGEIIAQCNAASFVKGRFKRQALQLLGDNLVDLIASDMHSTNKRPPYLKKAYEIIEKKMGKEVKDQLILNSEKIFSRCL